MDKNLYCLLFILCLFCSCDNKQERINELEAENMELRDQISELENEIQELHDKLDNAQSNIDDARFDLLNGNFGMGLDDLDDAESELDY